MAGNFGMIDLFTISAFIISVAVFVSSVVFSWSSLF